MNPEVVRMKLLNPTTDMKGMGWYTGKIAFPLLVALDASCVHHNLEERA